MKEELNCCNYQALSPVCVLAVYLQSLHKVQISQAFPSLRLPTTSWRWEQPGNEDSYECGACCARRKSV